eukprot:g3410.t1
MLTHTPIRIYIHLCTHPNSYAYRSENLLAQYNDEDFQKGAEKYYEATEAKELEKYYISTKKDSNQSKGNSDEEELEVGTELWHVLHFDGDEEDLERDELLKGLQDSKDNVGSWSHRVRTEGWIEKGHSSIGKRVRRYLGGKRYVNATVVGYLPPSTGATKTNTNETLTGDQSSDGSSTSTMEIEGKETESSIETEKEKKVENEEEEEELFHILHDDGDGEDLDRGELDEAIDYYESAIPAYLSYENKVESRKRGSKYQDVNRRGSRSRATVKKLTMKQALLDFDEQDSQSLKEFAVKRGIDIEELWQTQRDSQRAKDTNANATNNKRLTRSRDTNTNSDPINANFLVMCSIGIFLNRRFEWAVRENETLLEKRPHWKKKDMATFHSIINETERAVKSDTNTTIVLGKLIETLLILEDHLNGGDHEEENEKSNPEGNDNSDPSDENLDQELSEDENDVEPAEDAEEEEEEEEWDNDESSESEVDESEDEDWRSTKRKKRARGKTKNKKKSTGGRQSKRARRSSSSSASNKSKKNQRKAAQTAAAEQRALTKAYPYLLSERKSWEAKRLWEDDGDRTEWKAFMQRTRTFGKFFMGYRALLHRAIRYSVVDYERYAKFGAN